MDIGFISYTAAAIAYGFFAILLSFSWRCSLQGKLLFLVIAISSIWSAVAALVAADHLDLVPYYQVLELLRYMAWYLFLLKLLELAVGDGSYGSSYRRLISWILPMSVGFAALLLVNYWWSLSIRHILGVAGQVFLALIGLVIIEQLYRNVAIRYRWATKYLFMAVGGIFVFDFYFYADALLFRRLDTELWEARAVVNVVAVPLLVVSSARNKNWSLNIFVSREVVFNSATILGGGIFLLLMSAAGYYIKVFGGTWGTVGQVAFLTLAVILLASIIFSGQARARLKVFIAKHFYKNKYDYREEWLRLTGKLNEERSREIQLESVISTIACPVEAKAGQLWLQDERSGYRNIASWNMEHTEEVEPADSSFIRFCRETGYIINLKELDSGADEYVGLELPGWLQRQEEKWLVVPLFGQAELIGYIVLARPLIANPINWEDRDLLKTAAKQIVNYLTVLRTSDALAEAKQFEVFTRLSAYMVHDLKNIATELEMVALNAGKHRENPVFIDDAFDTVEHAASDIRRLLEQLRNKQARQDKLKVFDLVAVVRAVADSKQAGRPKPVVEAGGGIKAAGVYVTADEGRLRNVLGHLVDNAQQATDDDGEVALRLSTDQGMGLIEIEDNGHGMDEAFIRDRLFKAFDTTKGNAGMGIGMFESREYIRQLGGDISVSSNPGKGTIITLNLPLSSPTDGS